MDSRTVFASRQVLANRARAAAKTRMVGRVCRILSSRPPPGARMTTMRPRRSTILSASLAALLVPAAAPAHAQDALDAKSAATVRQHYLADLDTVHSKIRALAAAIPADKYAWRPAQG